jgi:hypothetical protein
MLQFTGRISSSSGLSAPFHKYGRVFPWHAGCLNHRSLSGCIGGTGVPPVISSWTGKMPAPLNSQEQGPKGDTVLAKRRTKFNTEKGPG